MHACSYIQISFGRMYLNLLAEEFAVSPIKVRKLLITSGAYKTLTSEHVGELFKRGIIVKEIQGLTGLSAASVSGYLLYQKTVYKLENTTEIATRLRRYRCRKALTEKLVSSTVCEDTEQAKEVLWETLTAFAGYPFRTAKGLDFACTVKGNEMFFHKEKTVTRVSLNKAFSTSRDNKRKFTEFFEKIVIKYENI